ncbi:hypothetical protein Peur_038146 [Populus x canadensis]
MDIYIVWQLIVSLFSQVRVSALTPWRLNLFVLFAKFRSELHRPARRPPPAAIQPATARESFFSSKESRQFLVRAL